MQAIVLGAGTLLAVLFILFALLGGKYSSAVDWLDNNEYPLSDLYVVGFMWESTPILRLRGKIGRRLRNEARLLYGEKYGEYYALLTWAQMITLVQLFAAVMMLLAGFADEESAGLLMLSVLLVCAGVCSNYLDSMKTKLKKRADACVEELPETISKLALLVNSGMVLREAWTRVAYGKDGEIYTLMRQTCEAMANGSSDKDAIFLLGVLSNSPEIKKFSSAMIQGMEKGSRDLVLFLVQQSTELWSDKKQRMLQKGEVAAGKLLIPIALMFAGILIIIITAALSGMSL